MKAKSSLSSASSFKVDWKALSSKTGHSKASIRRTIMHYRQAKNKLVTANLPLVHSVVRNTFTPTAQRSYEDMVQEGSTGLLRAAELYDPEKGLRFSTYAVVWIKGVLGNSLAEGDGVKVPLRERTKINKIQRFVEGYERDKGRRPNLAEIGEGTGMRVEEIEVVQRRVREGEMTVWERRCVSLCFNPFPTPFLCSPRRSLARSRQTPIHRLHPRLLIWGISGHYARQEPLV